MDDINIVIIEGRLTKDPVVSTTPNGTSVTNVTIASNETWRDKASREWFHSVSFVEVVIWAKLGEIVAERLHRGEFIRVRGKLQQDRWTASDGTHKNRMKVVAEKAEWKSTAPGNDEPPRPQLLDEEGNPF